MKNEALIGKALCTCQHVISCSLEKEWKKWRCQRGFLSYIFMQNAFYVSHYSTDFWFWEVFVWFEEHNDVWISQAWKMMQICQINLYHFALSVATNWKSSQKIVASPVNTMVSMIGRWGKSFFVCVCWLAAKRVGVGGLNRDCGSIEGGSGLREVSIVG